MELVETQDGTFTLYSNDFNEHYHSISDGALSETLNKHIIPAFEYFKNSDDNKKEINILDICFGLGYNSLATIYYLENKLQTKVNIFSPELDLNLIKSLQNFKYPKEFDNYKELVKEISNNLEVNYKNFNIKVFNQDARNFIDNTDIKFDIVYQDAFSPNKNPTLWTYEYFKNLKSKMSENSILTTYSIATPIRLALFYNNFYIYENLISIKKATIASIIKLNLNKNEIDMNLKLQRSSNVKVIYDKDLK